MKDMKKTYLSPRIKTLKIQSEGILDFNSVKNEVGDGNQLGKEFNSDDFNDFDHSDGEGPYEENVWE